MISTYSCSLLMRVSVFVGHSDKELTAIYYNGGPRFRNKSGLGLGLGIG